VNAKASAIDRAGMSSLAPGLNYGDARQDQLISNFKIQKQGFSCHQTPNCEQIDVSNSKWHHFNDAAKVK